MSYVLTTTDDRIGGVANPLDNEHLPLDPDKRLEVEDRELAEAIVDTYDEMVFVVDPDASEDEDSDSESEDEAQADSDESAEEGEDEESDVEICGVEMNDGSICERPADECPYHGSDSE